MLQEKLPAERPQQTAALRELKESLSLLSAQMDRLLRETAILLSQRGIDAGTLPPLTALQTAVRALAEMGSGTTPPPQAPAAASHPPHVTAAPQPQQACPRPGDSGDFSGRRGSDQVASDTLLARASAIIDLLVQSGETPEHAAQLITRQLLSVGINLPETGGDSRAWKRLFNWRNALIHHKRKGPAWNAYCAFKEELASIPPDQRLRIAVGERLWDRRQREISGQETG